MSPLATALERPAGAFEELAERRPEGLAYQASKLEDGVSFVHVADVSTLDGKSPLLEIGAFKAFTANIGERCDEKPVAMTVTSTSRFP